MDIGIISISSATYCSDQTAEFRPFLSFKALVLGSSPSPLTKLFYIQKLTTAYFGRLLAFWRGAHSGLTPALTKSRRCSPLASVACYCVLMLDELCIALRMTTFAQTQRSLVWPANDLVTIL